ncbi:MAG: hypothetical protein HC810_04460 [Acaryochloridaceae cyanobacterium RL_2_7]|nr:hypothetical protein [Acaryochloridaceae cyanobacterium RL_2_7]
MSIYFSLLNWMTLLVSTCAVVGVKVSSVATKPEAQPVKFVVMGDMPYSDYEREQLQGNIKAAIAAANVPFLIHYGDFKAGNVSCTDEVFRQAKADMDALHPRVFYTPGDNDWTDCDRSKLKQPVSELERLDFLRGSSLTLASRKRLAAKSNTPRMLAGGKMGFYFPRYILWGQRMAAEQVLLDDPNDAIARVNQRDQANQKWLKNAFVQATEKDAQAIVLVMQADISETSGQPTCTETLTTDCDPYEAFRAQLRQLASEFRDSDSALKPILLVHGDTFPFCLDSKFGGDPAPNLHRLNAWGDFQQPSDVTEITFIPGQTQAPFQIQTLVNQVKPQECTQK